MPFFLTFFEHFALYQIVTIKQCGGALKKFQHTIPWLFLKILWDFSIFFENVAQSCFFSSKIDPGQSISDKGRVNPIPTNLTLFCWNRVDSKIDPGQPISDKGRVNPIPTNLTLFCWNRVDSTSDHAWSTQFQQSQPGSNKGSQPDSNKVNPIPTKSFESTRFQQRSSQPDSNK